MKARGPAADGTDLPKLLLPDVAFIDPPRAWLAAERTLSREAGALATTRTGDATGAVIALAFLNAPSLLTCECVDPEAFGVTAEVLGSGCWLDHQSLSMAEQPLATPLSAYLCNCLR